MCIIIALKELTKIKGDVTFDALKRSWQSNSHGAGYAFIDLDEKGEPFVRIKKGFFKFKNFYKAFKKDREKYNNSKFLIHFRYASKGGISEENCHPFSINNTDAIAHNGTIYKFNAEKDTGDSDSKMLAEFLAKLPQKWYLNKVYVFLIEQFIGKNNKIAIITPENKLYIFNKSEWIIDGDIIYSSDYFKKERYSYENTPTKQEVDAEIEKDNKNSADTMVCSICGKHGFIKEKDKEYCLECYEKYNNKFQNERRCRICGTVLDENESRICSVCAITAHSSNETNVYDNVP